MVNEASSRRAPITATTEGNISTCEKGKRKIVES